MPSNHNHVHLYKIRFQDIVYLKLNKIISLKSHQQKELYLRCIKTDKKTRNYIFFSLLRDKSRENLNRQNEFVNDFGGGNDTENNKISILLLWQITLEKTPENKSITT